MLAFYGFCSSTYDDGPSTFTAISRTSCVIKRTNPPYIFHEICYFSRNPRYLENCTSGGRGSWKDSPCCPGKTPSGSGLC